MFYGWWIAFASAASFALSGGFYFYGFSTFFIPLEQQFGWSRMALSGAFSLSRLEGGIAGPIGGFLVDRFGPRRIMVLGILVMGAGYILLSRIDSLVSFYIVFVLLISVGASLGISVPPLVTTAKWFVKRRGLAMGIALSGVGVGGPLVPLLGMIVAGYGWQTATIVSGLTIWVLGLPLVTLMRSRPEHYGQFPDGIDPSSVREDMEEPGDRNAAKGNGSATVLEQNFTVGQALLTPVFWLLALAFGLRQLVISAVAIHQIPFLVDIGISQQLAATALGALATISIIGRVGFGWLGDHFEKRKVMAGALIMLALGCLILANVSSWWQIIPFLLIYSPAYGGGASLMFAIRGEYFGRESFGTISGLMDFIQMFGLVLGPIFAGFVYDATGSYQTAFYVFTASALLSTVLVLFLRKPALKEALSRQEEKTDVGVQHRHP